MTSTAKLRTYWAKYECNTAQMTRVAFPMPSGTIQLLVALPSAPAWRVFAEMMTRYDYLFREIAGGTYNCRNIGNSTKRSLHAYGIALDLNPQHNPQGYPVVHNYPQPFIDSVEALRTNSGASVFTWGGRWSASTPPDPMHWQIDCKPSDIASGIEYGDEMVTRDSKADDGLDLFKPQLDEMIAAGVMTTHTQPGGVTFNDELAVFLDRFEKHIVSKYKLGTGTGEGLSEDDVKAIINGSQIVPPA